MEAKQSLLTALERIEEIEEEGGEVAHIAVLYTVDHGETATYGWTINGLEYRWQQAAFLDLIAGRIREGIEIEGDD